MSVLIFDGSADHKITGTAAMLSSFLQQSLEWEGQSVEVFNATRAGIPFLDTAGKPTPPVVQAMVDSFCKADLHIWLSPLYHGGMPGVMKNCLDWLEVTSKSRHPYLTGKRVGLVCWADGSYALQGIQTMDNVARSLRAWTLPFFVPLVRGEICNEEGVLNHKTQHKLFTLVDVLLSGLKQEV